MGGGHGGEEQGVSFLPVPALAAASGARFRKIPPRLLPPYREILHRLLIRRGIEAEDAAAPAHFRADEIFERGHLEGLVGDFVGKMRRDDDDAVGIAQNDVAGKHRRVAAADRDIDFDRLVQGQVGRCARAVMIGGEAELGDLGRIAKAAIGDDAGDAASLRLSITSTAPGGQSSIALRCGWERSRKTSI
jgi:hypothetical protein